MTCSIANAGQEFQSKHEVINLRWYPQYGLCGMCSVPSAAGAALALSLYVDNSPTAVFVNDGKEYSSSRIYPDVDKRAFSLFARNGTTILSVVGA